MVKNFLFFPQNSVPIDQAMSKVSSTSPDFCQRRQRLSSEACGKLSVQSFPKNGNQLVARNGPPLLINRGERVVASPAIWGFVETFARYYETI